MLIVILQSFLSAGPVLFVMKLYYNLRVRKGHCTDILCIKYIKVKDIKDKQKTSLS